MASRPDENEFIVLICSDPNNQIEADISDEQTVISTTDFSTWDFPSIEFLCTLKIQAHRNRLIEASSYFRCLLSGSFSESCLDCISIQWQLETFFNVVKCIFGFRLDITSKNFISLFQDRGVQINFILEAASKMPMLRKVSLDICDAKEGDFHVPDGADRYSLRSVKIARCKSTRCNVGSRFAEAHRKPVHRETLVLVWNSTNVVRAVVKERL